MKFFNIDLDVGQKSIWTSILSNDSPFLLYFFSVEKKNKRNKKGIYQFTNLIQNLSAAAKAKAEILEPKRAIPIEVIEVRDNDSFNKLMDKKLEEYRNHLQDDPAHNSFICSSLNLLEMIKNKTFDFLLKNIDSVATGMSDVNNRQTWREILYANGIILQK